MSKCLVVYGSKYGSTKRYATFLSDALSGDLRPYKRVTPGELSSYDTVIFGGSLYAGNVTGIKWLIKNWSILKEKKVILFTCGLADPADSKNTAAIKAGVKTKVGAPIYDQLKVFHLRGGINYLQLSPLHKAMMCMMVRMLKKKDPTTLRDEDRQMIASYGSVVDFTDQKAITPLVIEAKKGPR